MSLDKNQNSNDPIARLVKKIPVPRNKGAAIGYIVGGVAMLAAIFPLIVMASRNAGLFPICGSLAVSAFLAGLIFLFRGSHFLLMSQHPYRRFVQIVNGMNSWLVLFILFAIFLIAFCGFLLLRH